MALVKRSVTIAGHRTSIGLEPEFWQWLDRLAAERGVPLASLVARIDQERHGPLASALRVFVVTELSRRIPVS